MGEETRENKKPERIFMTFQEAQDFLGVSHQTIYRLMRQGLPSHKIGKKRVFFKEDLTQWIKEH
jgi:excisionase family DNA binding protein